MHCKAFRRLKYKTQVFVSPAGDHYRTRLTHTLEVTQISRTVARALRLNEDLVEAIGLGHDLGHPPFGHVGEDALDRCLSERFGLSFMHHEHSLRVVDTLERDGLGLNLTAPVRDGIVSHSGRAQEPATLEGKIVRLMDRVAYINHDIDDAVRAGLLSPDDLPEAPIEILGETGPQRIDTLVHDLVEHSEQRGRHRPGRDGRRRDDRAAGVHVRARVPRARGDARAREDPPGGARRCSTTTAPTRTRSPTRSRRASSRAGSPTTWPG